ncbi:family 10 glycosylhydrolase [Sphaerospermopsis aphanizomenoides BCCUSP55]|uniref:glycoside hydrolase family 10 protein n=1 Tax=Sphaerospermopsis aphanizomenoides TaxID=459663 RepID=UPI001904D5BE|nr:family 10 glycosylhydrolase [Sphaerospermopsis aphanizomenoides]MBK1988840.1 family 10 glycosylhydrolase [Sphaerospermopsis aphanizomenoides BCCUSP55]
MVSTSSQFPDIQNHWARLFIQALVQRRIVNGYRDGTFRPDYPVTRAEFAAIIASIFTPPKQREYVSFKDVPETYWAKSAIQKVYETGFLVGYPDQTFRPNDSISRGDILVSMVNGLNIASQVAPDLVSKLPQIYQDSTAIPNYAINQIAIATRVGWVANYPNIKLLNPRMSATRADVAVMVYQALVYQGKAEKIASDYIVVPPSSNTVRVSHNREFRGVWVAAVWNSDWPSKPGLSVEQQKTELLEIIKQLQSLNFNALVLQVRPEGDALYASALEPWSAWITGTQGKPPEPFYDPLEFAIAECHKRNIELHAWFNPYRAKTTTKSGFNVSPHIAITNPEVVYQWGNQLWMDPGAKIVQDRAYNVIIDVVNRYNLDGVHLDDYFYPYPISGQSFPDQKTYAAYTANGGKLSLEDWRRENVNQMVLRLSQGIKKTKPHVKFGISPFGIYRPGQPSGIVGLDPYNVLYADSKKWLQEGWIDYLAPQLYWRTDQTQQSYEVLLKWWTEANTKQRHIYAGNNIGQLDNKAWKNSEIEKQIQLSRNLAGKFSLGNIFFSMSSLSENRQGIADQFKSTYYSRPAIVPTMSWQNATPPSPPKELKFENGRLNWQPGDNQPVRSWTLYRQNGDSWIIQRILSAGTTFATVQAGTYAVCAVDRLGNESAGVRITVS